MRSGNRCLGGGLLCYLSARADDANFQLPLPVLEEFRDQAIRGGTVVSERWCYRKTNGPLIVSRTAILGGVHSSEECMSRAQDHEVV
jgi:hypothetical protein